jgi:hypothetical protein
MITQKEIFVYLDDLRKSDIVNMFGARTHLMQVFDIPPARASATIDAWKKTYKQRHPREARS